MEFRFINNNAPLDRRSQRLVRNHAMKGKNLGRIIPARGHKRRQQEDEILPGHLTAEPSRSTEGGKGRQLLPKVIRPGTGPDMTLTLNPFSGAELAYFGVPAPLTSRVRYLLYEFHHDVSKELYPQVFCRQPKEKEASWLERVIKDPCVFHCAMALTRARISHSQGYGSKSPECAAHFLLALRLLRRDLTNSNSQPQYSSIIASISLAIYANLDGSISESRIHLQGLKRILELHPGGLAVLHSSFPEVGNKIRRTDLDLALSAGTPTLFGSQPRPLPGPPYVVPLDDRIPNITLPHPLGEAAPVICFAMTDVLALCKYAGRAQLSALQYQDLVISILQRLLDYAPLSGERPLHPLDDVCQLGLIAFMSTVLNHTREKGSNYSPLLSDLLWARLDRFDDEVADRQASKYPSLHLWLVFIYAVSSPEYRQCCDTDSPVARCIRVLANALALETWEDVAAHLNPYPWVAAFHDEPSKKLWAVTCR